MVSHFEANIEPEFYDRRIEEYTLLSTTKGFLDPTIKVEDFEYAIVMVWYRRD